MRRGRLTKKQWLVATGALIAGILVVCCGISAVLPSEEPVRNAPITTFTKASPTPTATESLGVEVRETKRARSTKSPRRPRVTPKPAPKRVYYETCADAPGALYRGDPGYGSHLDRDNDGVACES